MSRPEDTLHELARLAREDEALRERLPLELQAPLSAEKTAALVDSIHARLAPPRSPRDPVPPVRRSRFVAAGGATIAALAAAVLFWVGRPPDSDAPLPFYDVRVEGAQQSERSGAQRAELLRLRPDSKLRFELRPKQDFSGNVSARVVLVDAGREGDSLELEVAQERSATGALKVEARLPTGLPERGELMLVVSRASSEEGARRFPWRYERSP
jgi:hypothetical protein